MQALSPRSEGEIEYERDILEMRIATVFPRHNPDPFRMILALLSNSPMFKRYLAWFSLWHSATFLRTERLWWQQNLIKIWCYI